MQWVKMDCYSLGKIRPLAVVSATLLAIGQLKYCLAILSGNRA